MGKEQDTIELKIPAKDEYVTIMRLCVSGIGAHMKFTVDEIEDIKMAVGEACINAIHHGYESKGNSKDIVTFQFTIYRTQLVVTVKDDGKGFDITKLDKYTQQYKEKNIGEKKLGIFLIKSLMDEVEFASSPTGTQVKMVKSKRE